MVSHHWTVPRTSLSASIWLEDNERPIMAMLMEGNCALTAVVIYFRPWSSILYFGSTNKNEETISTANQYSLSSTNQHTHASIVYLLENTTPPISMVIVQWLSSSFFTCSSNCWAISAGKNTCSSNCDNLPSTWLLVASIQDILALIWYSTYVELKPNPSAPEGCPACSSESSQASLCVVASNLDLSKIAEMSDNQDIVLRQGAVISRFRAMHSVLLSEKVVTSY